MIYILTSKLIQRISWSYVGIRFSDSKGQGAESLTALADGGHGAKRPIGGRLE